jgi:hypothetical protein
VPPTIEETTRAAETQDDTATRETKTEETSGSSEGGSGDS